MTVATWNGLDIVINNAGILNDDKWELQVAINVVSLSNTILLNFQVRDSFYHCGGLWLPVRQLPVTIPPDADIASREIIYYTSSKLTTWYTLKILSSYIKRAYETQGGFGKVFFHFFNTVKNRIFVTLWNFIFKVFTT